MAVELIRAGARPCRRGGRAPLNATAPAGAGKAMIRTVQDMSAVIGAHARRALQAASLGALAMLAVILSVAPVRAAPQVSPFDEKTALAYSQAAIGRTLGSHRFRDRTGKSVDLADFAGKPLIVNLIYTSCYNTCPMIVSTLYDALKAAQGALGEDAFSVVTIGFDTDEDTPGRMRAFASTRGVALPNWRFLSGDEETIAALTKTLGFIFFPSPKGFDHLAQVTIIDENGKVYRQVYGDTFPVPAIVEPLKELVFGRGLAEAGFSGLANRIRLFCTLYDARAERYYFDYSVFVGLIIGAGILGFLAFIIMRNIWRLWRQGRVA